MADQCVTAERKAQRLQHCGYDFIERGLMLLPCPVFLLPNLSTSKWWQVGVNCHLTASNDSCPWRGQQVWPHWLKYYDPGTWRQVPRASLRPSPHCTSAMTVGVGGLWPSVGNGRVEGMEQMLHNLQPCGHDFIERGLTLLPCPAFLLPNLSTSKWWQVRVNHQMMVSNDSCLQKSSRTGHMDLELRPSERTQVPRASLRRSPHGTCYGRYKSIHLFLLHVTVSKYKWYILDTSLLAHDCE